MIFVLKRCLILILMITNVCYAQVVLRFQNEIDEKAMRLGDIVMINTVFASEAKQSSSSEYDTGLLRSARKDERSVHSDIQNWSTIPLDSHPTPGEIITKAKILDWMTQRLGHFDATWHGKTKIQVKQSNKTSGNVLIKKARAALIAKLGTHYSRVEVTPLSHPKDSAYAPDEFKIKIDLPFPTPKRVCVWLLQGNKRTAVWFKVKAYANVLVANHDIRYNTAPDQNAFSMKQRNIAGLNAPPAQTIPQHVWLKSTIERDMILLENQLKEPPLVIHGQHVKVATHNHSITIVMDAIALVDGYLGETITVKNPLNQKTFVAKISGFQQAEIS